MYSLFSVQSSQSSGMVPHTETELIDSTNLHNSKLLLRPRSFAI